MTERKRDDGKVPSKRPSFGSFEDDPLATAGTGGSEDPKGLVRRGGARFPLTATAKRPLIRKKHLTMLLLIPNQVILRIPTDSPPRRLTPLSEGLSDCCCWWR